MSQPLYLPHTVQQGPPHHCFCWFTCQAGKKMAWGVAVFPWSRVGRWGGICTLTKKRPVNTSSCFQLVTTPRDLRPLTPGFAFHVFQMVNLFAKYVHLEKLSSPKSIQIPISHMFGRLLYWLFHLRQHDVHQNPPDRPNPAKIGIPSASELLLFQLLHGRHQLGLLCQGPGSFGGLQHRDTQLPTTDVEDLPRPQQG